MGIYRHGKKWRGQVWHDGRSYHTKPFTDKLAAKVAETELMQRLERGEKDLLDRYAKVMKTPITEHLTAYLANMCACGGSRGWVITCQLRLKRMLLEMGVTCPKDLSPNKLLIWRDGPHKIMQGTKDGPQATTRQTSPETINQCRRTLLAFVRWMAKHDRCKPDLPLELCKIDPLVSTEAHKRRDRRALSKEELGSLFGVIADSHRLFYRMSLLTGLRVSEVKALQWQDIHWDSEPRLELRAMTTKARRADVIPLHPDLVAVLQPSIGLPLERVCPNIPTIDQHKAYLNTACIPFVDASGRRVDLHSLRHTFISNLARAGVHPKTAQKLARHSSIELTMKRYTHLGMSDLANAIEKVSLPAPTQPNLP